MRPRDRTRGRVVVCPHEIGAGAVCFREREYNPVERLFASESGLAPIVLRNGARMHGTTIGHWGQPLAILACLCAAPFLPEPGPSPRIARISPAQAAPSTDLFPNEYFAIGGGGRATAFGDLDGDEDQDLVVAEDTDSVLPGKHIRVYANDGH